MDFILPKNQMSEEDVKLNFITPALIKSGWQNKITMETKAQFTDGKINLKGNLVNRSKPKFCDYVLYYNSYKPIAIVEAKDNNHSVSHGLQQAMTYAQMLDVPFAYSSNGDAFEEYDFLTGNQRTVPLDEFPTKEELYSRWKSNSHDGAGISEQEEEIINQPYYTSQKTFAPRYYQRNAINKTVEAIARNEKRLLLVMATGTGKTYTAFQIIYRLLQSKMIKKVLYLADRNILVDQSIQQDFAPLEKVIHKVNVSKDKKNIAGAYQMYFSLYQQLVGEDGTEHYSELFDKDFFDLVVVDECHRGSAKFDSSWRKILEYFSSAAQIGMTATPKETKYISNLNYFGEPIYTYSLNQGIEDGFLAPFKVVNITTNIGDGWRPVYGQKDIYGNLIEDRIYNNKDYDYNIIIQDRINEVAQEITEYLKSTDRMQKTIVFCANEDHAEMMKKELINLNSDMMQKNSDYVVRITGSDEYGKNKLDYFISVNSDFPVIATTSKLLSTGVDCKMVKLICLDQNINSMTEFKQIIGRGTRLRPKEGKTHFVVMDFRGVTRLFADPDWDGPIEIKEGFGEDKKSNPPALIDPPPIGPEPIDPPPKQPKPIVDVNGCNVIIINKTVSVYNTNGKLLTVENIIDYTKSNVLGTYASLDNFIRQWNSSDKKKTIKEEFESRGIDISAVKRDEGMEDFDDFDFICHIAFDAPLLTRKERAENVKKRDFLHKYNGVAKQVLESLLDKYMNEGIYDIEETTVLKLDPFKQLGSPSKIAKTYFGGSAGYKQALKELEEEIYKVG